MRLAFVTAALAAGFAAAVVSTLVIWVATVVIGSDEPWAVAPWVVAAVAVLFGAATYVAEGLAHRRTRAHARMRATGEPWAFRD